MHPCVGLHPSLQHRGEAGKQQKSRRSASVLVSGPWIMIAQGPRMSRRYDVGRPNRILSENSDGVGPARTYPPHVSRKGPSAFVLGCRLISVPVFRRGAEETSAGRSGDGEKLESCCEWGSMVDVTLAGSLERCSQGAWDR